MLVDGLFNVQGIPDKPGKKGIPNGEEVISTSGVRYWVNWFKGAQAYLGREDAKGLYFPPGNYPFKIDEMLELKDGQIIMGVGWESRIFRDRPRGELKPKDKTKPKGEKEWVWDIPKETWRPMFRTNGKDICIRNLSLDSGGGSPDGVHPIEVIGNSKNIRLDNIRCSNGNTAMWIKTGQEIRITNCESTGFLHNIYLGHQDNTSAPPLRDILISNCVLGDSKKGGSDGIKTLGRCNNLVIDRNVIRNCFKDAIDLFASGDRIVISNNDLQNNGFNGIDIKTDYRTYPEKWGNQGQNLVIVGNLINGNGGHGIKIWAEYDVPKSSILKTPFNIVLMSNQITENGYGGIACEAPHVSIVSNQISQNASGFVKDRDGNFLPKPDKNGNITYKKDRYGNYIYKYKEDGTPRLVYEKNTLGEYVYRDKDENFVPTTFKDGNVVIDKNIEYQKDDDNIVYTKIEVKIIDENMNEKTITKMIPLPKKFHDREFEPNPVRGHGIYLQPPADVKRDPKNPSKVLSTTRGQLQSGTITNNIIMNNGHPELFDPKAKVPLNSGIFCAGGKSKFSTPDKPLFTLENILLSQNILANDPNQPNPYQGQGITLVSAKNIMITDNHFGTGNAEERAVYNDQGSTFTASNNIGLDNRIAPARFTVEELEQFKKDGSAKAGELVYITNLSEYLKDPPPQKLKKDVENDPEETPQERKSKDPQEKFDLERQLQNPTTVSIVPREYSNLAYFDGRSWLCLLTTGQKVPR